MLDMESQWSQRLINNQHPLPSSLASILEHSTTPSPPGKQGWAPTGPHAHNRTSTVLHALPLPAMPFFSHLS